MQYTGKSSWIFAAKSSTVGGRAPTKVYGDGISPSREFILFQETYAVEMN